jgi:hypothetical protein
VERRFWAAHKKNAIIKRTRNYAIFWLQSEGRQGSITFFVYCCRWNMVVWSRQFNITTELVNALTRIRRVGRRFVSRLSSKEINNKLVANWYVRPVGHSTLTYTSVLAGTGDYYFGNHRLNICYGMVGSLEQICLVGKGLLEHLSLTPTAGPGPRQNSHKHPPDATTTCCFWYYTHINNSAFRWVIGHCETELIAAGSEWAAKRTIRVIWSS